MSVTYLSRRNTSGFRGVAWHRSSSRWQVRFGDGRLASSWLGTFDSKHAAAIVYDLAALEADFAYHADGRINYPALLELRALPTLASVIDALRALDAFATEAEALAVVGVWS